MIKIYGSPLSSAGRCYLVLEELGVSYEAAPLDMRKGEHKGEAYLKLNPNGKVPCMIDGDFVLWESLAINQYLVEKYKPELLGTNLKEKALVQQWNTWAIAELQPPLVSMLIQMIFTPEEKRDMALVESSRAKVPPMLAILDKSLANKRYIVGDKMTLADLNLASVVNLAFSMQIPLEPYPSLLAWFSAIKDRPAFKKFSEVRKG